MIIAYSIGFLIPILALSLLSATFLRFASEIVVKKVPKFSVAFWISAGSFTLIFISTMVLNSLGQSNATVSPIINLFPLLIGFLVSWALTSNNILDSDEKPIGYGRGLIVIFLQFGFLLVIGIVAAGIFFLLVHRY